MLSPTLVPCANTISIGTGLTRPVARGKFICAGGKKLWVRGATYGAFRSDDQKREYQDIATIERDFAQMAQAGFNAVRIPHTMPPRHLLDIAARHGLRVMAGLSAEQYIGYLADRKKGAPDIDELIRVKVRSCRGHPALLCYALGNEIPASMVRWLGRRRVERYLERLYHAVKAEDPDTLVTYVNYPSTEYLQLPFLDVVAFNVYLESQERLEAYLARLQNIAGDRPLLMSELGLDSLRNGEMSQARTLDWQIRTTFAAGCTGAFIFSWTDEWYRGGADVDDWAFGLTDRERRHKPALAMVRNAFKEVPFPRNKTWPRISVVVCVYNGERTLRDCCDGLSSLDYPNYEIIVVDDGSTDATASIAAEFGGRLIRTSNQGLCHARNVGLEAATGEIIAYTDGDARPDPHWLVYLAHAFETTSHVGIGGWNIAPHGDGWMADCVASAPGGPVHVLLSDREAEHIPGCSMAFRVSALKAIGGFDPQFRSAGDDVDVCWRLQEQGWTLGFSHGAMVWHHQRDSLAAYWRQQRGYGQAEAMLERKWPQKYNVVGHLTWGGRLYGRGLTLPIGRAGRIYQGTWGLAPFQTRIEESAGCLRAVPLMPEWHLVIGILGLVSVAGAAWAPLLAALPLFLLALAAPVVQAWTSTANLSRPGSRTGMRRLGARVTVAWLHLLQPVARLRGRLKYGLTVWRKRGPDGLSAPLPRTLPICVTFWQPPEARLGALDEALRAAGAVVVRGNAYDSWDLEVRGGLFGRSRLLMAFEDTGSGTQLVRLRAWPYCAGIVWGPAALVVVFAGLAGFNGVSAAAVEFGSLAMFLVARVVLECGASMRAVMHAAATVGLLNGALASAPVRRVTRVPALQAEHETGVN
jgi:GT2 family glycosyltransferase